LFLLKTFEYPLATYRMFRRELNSCWTSETVQVKWTKLTNHDRTISHLQASVAVYLTAQ
jgi:hypothetical protein